MLARKFSAILYQVDGITHQAHERMEEEHDIKLKGFTGDRGFDSVSNDTVLEALRNRKLYLATKY